MPDVSKDITRDIAIRVREQATHRNQHNAPDTNRLIDNELTRFAETQLARGLPLTTGDEEAMRVNLEHALTGLGPLQPYLDDPEVEEIWLNAPDRVFIARAGKTNG
jgi:pilus assembly protein CpaF